MKNMARTAIVLGVVAFAPLASAELTLTGIGRIDFLQHAELLSEIIDNTVVDVPGSLSITVNDISSYRVSRQFDEGNVIRMTYFSMTTGAFPVQVGNIQTHYNGKYVYSGAQFDDTFIWINDWSIVEVFDLVEDGVWDNEVTWDLSTQDTTDSGFTDQGLMVIDEPGKPMVPDPVMLAPNSVFAVRLREQLFSFHEITPLDPNIVMTAEWVDPAYTGAHIEFQYRAVPEPATLCLAPLGGLIVIRRRRR